MSDRATVLEQVQSAPPDVALRIAADRLDEKLLEAMKVSRVSKAEQSIEALKKSGLDLLLVRALGRGRLSLQMVDRELERMRRALVERTLTANDLKDGIRVFDSEAQKLSLAAGKAGTFTYRGRQNRARDSLITFGRSLHR